MRNYTLFSRNSDRKETNMYASSYVWAKVLTHMENLLTPAVISTWFDDAEVVELTDEFLILYTPDEFRKDMIIRRCTEHAQDALKELFGSDAKLKVFGQEEYQKYKQQGKQSFHSVKISFRILYLFCLYHNRDTAGNQSFIQRKRCKIIRSVSGSRKTARKSAEPLSFIGFFTFPQRWS